MLYDDFDFISTEKIIEAVCNDMDYQILKIDDLENRKMLRFHKISEATQSKRISSISDALNNKVDILDKILNNNTERFLSFFNNNNNEINNEINNCNNEINNYNKNNHQEKKAVKYQAKNIHSKKEKDKDKDKNKEIKKNNNKNLQEKNPINGISISNLINISKEITDFYTSNITKEREVFKAIKHNMMKFINNKKTLILISDTFTNIEESKSYLNTILGKVNETKTPIIILTSI